MNYLQTHLVSITFVCLSFVVVKGQELKMNQTQVIGSHNSYKIGIEKPLMDIILSERPEATGLDYRHISITQQLDLGLRSLEIDVLYDPEGGRFSHPKGLEMLRAQGVESQPYTPKQWKIPASKCFMYRISISEVTVPPSKRVCLISKTGHNRIAITCRSLSPSIQRLQDLTGRVCRGHTIR
ncbi:MAG: hypothetical protein HC859_07050 [Bacteroidia bacterium]|nr:hypothetical protein [Bacteroidia bacterium]